VFKDADGNYELGLESLPISKATKRTI